MRHLHRSRLLGVAVLLAAAPVTVAGVAVAAQADGGPSTPAGRDLGGVVDTLLPTTEPTSEPTTTDTLTPTLAPSPTPSMETNPGPTKRPTPSAVPGKFYAPDGHYYPAGRQIVKSRDKKELFWGEDFDTACYDGTYFSSGLAALERVAQMIEDSGRRVVLVVPPNKSAVDLAELKGLRLPHRTCARKGVYAQRNLLAHYRSSHFLPLLPGLTKPDENTYWRTDTHWNPLGAAIYAKRLGMRLDKRVGRAYAYRAVTAKRYTDLARPYGKKREKSNGAKPTVHVRVKPAAGAAALSLDTATTADYRWTASPADRTIGGRTVLIGDSFTYIGLKQLRPLFRDGHFLWTGLVPDSELTSGIINSDTVVIEVVQRFVAQSVLGTEDFQADLASALSANPRPR